MTENPYATPAADLAVTLPRQLFPELSTKEVKQLKDWSTNIQVMGVFWALAILGLPLIGFASWEQDKAFGIFACVMAAAMVPAVYGCWARPAWARVPGMVFSALYLPGFPLGTLIGGLALRSFYKGKALFGEGRIRPADLAKELKHRKANKID